MADTLLDLADGFGAARGVAADAEWARVAAARFVLEDVRLELARRALGDAHRQVAESGESPVELYGDPVAWVRTQREDWRAEGETFTEPPRQTPVRELVIASLVGAAVVTVFLLVARLLQREWRESYTWPLLLAPLLLATTGQVVRGVHERVLRARSQRAALLAATAAVLALAAALAAFFLGTSEAVVIEVSNLWLVLSAAAYAALAALVGSLWPERAVAPVAADTDDDAWLAGLAAALRQRGDMTDRRVAQVLAETRSHAAEAGTPLAEEFGPTAEYAGRFPADEPVVERRRAWFYTVLSAFPAALLVSDVLEEGWRWGSPHLSALLWLLLAGGLALSAWRRVLRSR
ncbi:hypothetical protein M3148_03370 [Georgenia satyanarayanai]|uniref:hypothetical protein n=1 Tax=Georgenia satyanarayanai TaxID=860221 RepID=UPI002041FC3B|nr:hypothetical protein [Georgenia satyanarayanai]MCM3660039.1 hypothetical protein [Georgenia satyanarayanai]